MENIAGIVKELREMGMTQAEIGQAIQVSQGYVSTIEAGKRGTRTPADTLERARAVRDSIRAQQTA